MHCSIWKLKAATDSDTRNEDGAVLCCVFGDSERLEDGEDDRCSAIVGQLKVQWRHGCEMGKWENGNLLIGQHGSGR
jgi:hypothetical protein